MAGRQLTKTAAMARALPVQRSSASLLAMVLPRLGATGEAPPIAPASDEAVSRMFVPPLIVLDDGRNGPPSRNLSSYLCLSYGDTTRQG